MKQNLMQKQLKQNQQKRPSFHQNNDDSFQEHDLTAKAFYITRQLLESKFIFTKKALANFLKGKPIILQQKNNQQPPSVLKGYMILYDFDWIEEMIEVMIRLNVLKEEKHLLQKKSTTRLFATTKYDWNIFPKVIIKIIQKPRSEQSIIKRPNYGNSEMSKSRFTIFLKQKITLPVNQEKRKHQMQMKTQKQKQEEQEKIRAKQDEVRWQKQTQMRQKQKIQKQEQQKVKKEEQQKNYQSQMNNFWMKERQKIEQFICPKTDISLLESPNIRRSMRQKEQADQKPVIQTAGYVLQMQMKQLKEIEDKKKNPIKPIVSWSFMKGYLDSDNSQRTGYQNGLNQVKPQGNSLSIIEETCSKKECPPKPSRKSSNKKSLIKLDSSFLKEQQKNQYVESFSESTQVTQTNYKLRNCQKKTKNQSQIHSESNQKPINPFAQNPQQSMFSSNYYSARRSTQSIPDRNQRKQTKNNKKSEEIDNFEPFSFKRKKYEQNSEETITIAKRPASNTSSFEQLDKVLKKPQKQPYKQFKNYQFQDSQTDDYHFQHSPQHSQTKTIAMPKTIKQRTSFNDTRRMSFRQESPYLGMDMFSQTISVAEPRIKNQKTSTKDLKSFVQTQPVIKRDSFVQELMDNYYKRK